MRKSFIRRIFRICGNTACKPDCAVVQDFQQLFLHEIRDLLKERPASEITIVLNANRVRLSDIAFTEDGVVIIERNGKARWLKFFHRSHLREMKAY